ncbi:Immunoglobulin-like domain of spore germination [Quadrisphaera granulorum]|uniref:Immunoglobulin-like protein involved in spore germination n=1 Tax=Quadrisphaera granulorum TaxID=317664 RepID=A0A316A8R9_9ACTN|nr:Gmad2 immunoglobulin-like domain-containing protein [Quadrisphaera granulorum]PWJ54033.1 immunoglobulin-like protein involved in spore germination [Quadrisphaera granulorum]SZE96490.1 Immunoglobulin-like domain of spore germination [Quadrisphaera granulorum]
MHAHLRTLRARRAATVAAGSAAALALLLTACGQQSPQTEPVGGSASSTDGASSSSSPSTTSTATASGTAATAPGPAATGTGLSKSVVITAPVEGQRLPAGPMGIVGQGTAFEGTLLWKITQADGTVLSDGNTMAGANGDIGEFSISQTVQKGTCTPCTAEVWAPDESGGEGLPEGPAKVTFYVD